MTDVNFDNGNEMNTSQEDTQTNYYQENDYVQSSVIETADEQKKATDPLAVVSLVMGILSIILCCCYGIGVIFGIPGLICAIISRKKGKTGLSTAGLICSIIGLILSVLAIIYYVVCIVYAMSNPDFMDMIQMMEYYY